MVRLQIDLVENLHYIPASVCKFSAVSFACWQGHCIFIHLIEAYVAQFKNLQLISGGLLMRWATCFVYIFAALAPFIAIDMLHMSSTSYGAANLLPPIGLVLGSLFSAQLAKSYQAKS